MYLVIAVIFWLIAWRWGNWRNFYKYYPTILFMIAAALFYEFVCYEYQLWQFHPVNTYFKNMTQVTLVITLSIFPATMMLFLSNYPQTIGKQIAYNLGWALLYLLIEYAALRSNMISYHHGWHLGWSALVDLIMFPILRLHYSKPLWAWVVCIVYVIWTWNLFDIPFRQQ